MQQAFIAEYLVDHNAKRAAIRAGYSPATAETTGHKNLQKPQIASAIQEVMDERSRRTGITSDHVLEEIASIANDDISNYLDFHAEKVQVGEEDGVPIYERRIIVEVKDSKTINTKNISEISIGKDGQFKFKLYNRDEALVNLGKHLKLFTDKTEITGPNGGKIELDIALEGMSDDDLLKTIERTSSIINSLQKRVSPQD